MSRKNMNKVTKKSSGSKTSNKKPPVKKAEPVSKKRGRRSNKILSEDTPVVTTSSQKKKLKPATNPAVIVKLNVDPSKFMNRRRTNISTTIPEVRDELYPEGDHNDSKKKFVANKPRGRPPIKSKLDSMYLEKRKESRANLNKAASSNETPGYSLSDDSDSGDESSSIFRNDIPRDTVCKTCAKNKELIEQLRSKIDMYERKNPSGSEKKVHVNKLNIVEKNKNRKLNLKETKALCAWDCHSINGIPFPIPDFFHKNTYYYNSFLCCSPECAVSYIFYVLKDSKVYERHSLVYQLYKDMYGLSPTNKIQIKQAPPRELLTSFGGTMTIKEYRKNLHILDREYIKSVPPIQPIQTIIEEVDVDASKNDDKKGYVLKRKNPRAKKRSVLTSMNMKFNDDDD